MGIRTWNLPPLRPRPAAPRGQSGTITTTKKMTPEQELAIIKAWGLLYVPLKNLEPQYVMVDQRIDPKTGARVK